MKKNRYPFIISLSVWPISSLIVIACIGRIRGCSGPREWTPDLIRIGILIGLIVWLYFLMETFSQAPESWSRKSTFSNPRPPKELLHKNSGGIIFGRYKKWWVESSKRISHLLIIGQSGSGKSVLLLSTLIANTLGLMPDKGKRKPRALFVLDLKGELSYKSSLYAKTGENTEAPCVLSIQKRQLFGYDFLYKLHREGQPSSQELISTINQLVNYLVPRPADVKDPFFIDASRNLLNGLIIGYIREAIKAETQYEFIDIIDKILGSPIEEQIRHFLSEARTTSAEHRYLIEFSGQAEKAGNETLASVFSEMSNNLTVFVNDQNVRFFLKTNPRRAAPDTLYRDHRSMYLTLDESHLEQYSTITRVILAQVIDAAFELPDCSDDDSESAGYMLILDEIARVLNGSRDMSRLLTNAIKTLRSKNVICICVSQTISSFHESMGNKAIVDDFVSNFEYTVVLSAKDSATAQWLSDISGKFLQRSISTSGHYGNRKSTTSYQLQSLVTPDELLTLQTQGKELLICPFGVFRLDRARYYTDPFLSKASLEFQRQNQKMNELIG